MLLTLLTKKGSSGGGSTFATLNPADKGTNITLSNGNLTSVATANLAQWNSTRSTIGKSVGKWLVEFTPLNNNTNTQYGFGNSLFSLATFLGGSTLSAGLQIPTSGNFNGVTYNGGVLSFTNSPILMALDMSLGRGWIGQGNVWSQGDPTTNTSPAFTWAPGTLIFFATGNLTIADSISVNVGQSAFGNATIANAAISSGYNNGWF